MINFLVKLWYKLPRLKFSIEKYYPDKRSYTWYMDKKKYGFDNRELWNLSISLDAKIRKRIGLPVSENKFVTKDEWLRWINSPSSRPDVIWFHKRVKRYVELNAHYSFYDEKKDDWMSKEDTRWIIARYEKILGERAQGIILHNEELEFLFTYDRFGY